jgi:hypothetical protein
VAGPGRLRTVTLTVRGPAGLDLYAPRGQVLPHDGRSVTVWSGTLTESEVSEVVGLLQSLRLEVGTHVVDTDESIDERERLHTIPEEGIGVLPTAACPSCAWLDSVGGRFVCGASTWHVDVARSYNVGKAADDLAECPVGVVISQVLHDTPA